MFEEKMALLEIEKNSNYMEEEEQRIFQRASLAKQRLALEGTRSELVKKERGILLREQHLEERSRAKALSSIQRTLEAVEKCKESMQLREIELQQWEASMMYGKDNGVGATSGTNMRLKEEENRSKRLELIEKIGQLTSKIVELQRENEDLKLHDSRITENIDNVENDGVNSNNMDGKNALDLYDREKKLKRWAETLRKQQKCLDDDALSLATDLKSLKGREERLKRATDDAVRHGSSSNNGINTSANFSMNASLNNSWSNALGLE